MAPSLGISHLSSILSLHARGIDEGRLLAAQRAGQGINMQLRHTVSTRSALAVLMGIGSIATAETTVTFQVRSAGGEWTTSTDAMVGSRVEFRVMLTSSGPVVTRGLGGFLSQPTLSRTIPGDSLAPFEPILGVDVNTQYGRRNFPGLAGISASNGLQGHVDEIGGIRYLRIATANATNPPGSGSGANNVTGAGGIQMTQYPGPLAGDAHIRQTSDLEVYRFAIDLAANVNDERTLVVTSDPAAMIIGSTTPLVPRVNWWVGPGTLDYYLDSDVVIEPAFIHVPGASSVASLLLVPLLACRRRRGRS